MRGQRMTIRYTGDSCGINCATLNHRPDMASLLVDMIFNVVEKRLVSKVNSNRFVLVAEAHGRV